MTQGLLLPERHPNNDFFIADIFDALPFKNDRHTMEHPFFALSTKKDTTTIKYEQNGIQVKLSPSAEFGLPTMMDKDILLYCGSLLMAEFNRGKPPPKTIRFSCHDLMVTTNRHTNDVAYKQLSNAFERLAGCLITTNIKTNKVEQSEGFHIIESYRVLKSSHSKKRMVRVEVTVSDWLYNSLVGGEVLTISRNYFRLRKALERRLYEIARKFCGRHIEWKIKLQNLKEKCGSRASINKFRFQIRNIIKSDKEENHFPDYAISLSDKDVVTFNQKKPKQSFELDNLPTIKPETIRKGAKIVENAGTGWDYNAIREQFTLELIKGFNPDKVDGAFINFVKKKVVKSP